MGRSVDAGGVYSSARDAARLAVTEAENFGLTDVATEDEWRASSRQGPACSP